MHRVSVVVLAAIVSSLALARPEDTNLSHWKTVLSFRPSAEVQKLVRKQGADWAVHRIEDAVGDVNLDIYSVHISKMPTIDGKKMTAATLLEHIRLNLNALGDTDVAVFKPFNEEHKRTWESSDYSSAIILIDMKSLGLSVDSGCVVATRRTKHEWIFSTIRAGGPAKAGGKEAVAHPVSGNRAFGIYKGKSGGWVFYTVAADRLTRSIDRLAEVFGAVSSAQNTLWTTMQEKVVALVNENDGMATLGTADVSDHDWDTVKKSRFYDVSDQPEWQ